MKIDRHGRAKILTHAEIQLLFAEGFTLVPLRDRTLFALCLYTACRINECVTLHTRDVYDSKRRVRPVPGRYGRGHLHPDSASWILREACRRVGIEGVSTHSFRRTALTQMSNAGIPLRVIQEISGHRTLDELYKYLEVSPEQVRGAIAALSMLTPVEEPAPSFVKPSLASLAAIA